MNNEIITLAHGAGGRAAQRLIDDYIKKYFSNEILDKLEDGSVLELNSKKIVMTTDSFVVNPVFFAGGDIGKLSICGTVNDLAAMGARPMYITAGLIIEEGLEISDFERILSSMKKTAEESGVKIIAGDTKVVEKGKADRIYINTAGIGEIINTALNISASSAKEGDFVIISGTTGDHETAILKEREGIGFEADIKSDCAPLNNMIEKVINTGAQISVMRDPTRGGLATVLNEIAAASGVEIKISEELIPVNEIVKSACSILGFEPVYMANEGKMVIITAPGDEKKVLEALRKTEYGKEAAVIGKVTGNKKPAVIIETISGGERILMISEGENLPRIC